MRIQTDNFGFNEAFRCRLHENSYNYPAHLHQFTEFAIILDGELEITVNDNKRVAKQGDIAVISPFAVHSFSTPKYCKIWIAVFSDTYILDFNIQHGLHKKDFIFTPTKSLFNYVEEHFINMPEINLHSIRACVYTLLEEYSRFVPSEEQKKEKQNILADIFRYMSNNFKENISLKTLAQELNYSTRNVSKTLSTLPNINFYTILTSLRIEHSKQLILNNDNARIIDIALECGFSTERSFHRSFKKSTGMTPLEYKRLHG